MYLLCLSYHFPSAEIRLFSPQTYHTLYGGHNTVFGDRVVMIIDHLSINIPINSEAGNVPMIHNTSCSATEVKKIGPLIRSALPHYTRKVAMMGSSVSSNFLSWGIDNEVSDFLNHFRLQNNDVSLQANIDMSGAQTELMLWHLKLGVSMSHVQRLMKVLEIHEPNERVSVMDRAIVPNLNRAANCEIPLC